MDLINNFSMLYLERLDRARSVILVRNNDNEVVSFKCYLDYFHLKKHIPPWKYGDENILLYKIKIFLACRLMQNMLYLYST